MGHVKYTYRVDAPPERLFELGVMPERFPEWLTSIAEIKDVTGPLDRVGAAYTAVMKIAGRPLEVRWEVVKLEKPFRVEMRGAAPGGWATYSVTNEPMGMSTEVTIELDYELPGGFVGQFADKLFVERAIERDLRHSSENFKAINESEVPVPA